MKVIFHIGMGKTGTSSIQAALRQNQDVLEANNAHYLGMWFDFIDPAYDGVLGTEAFITQTPDVLCAQAETFFSILQEKGYDLYIHSNEALFERAEALEPFFSTLIGKGVDVCILAYLRPPHDWLPSAFTQWNINHKPQKGPVQTFRQRAPALLNMYAATKVLHENFPNHFDARLFDKSVDVVADFSDMIGLQLELSKTRSLERTTDAETVLRALFNDRYKEPVMPALFTNTVMQGHWSLPRTLEDMIERTLEFEGLDEIIADRTDLFTYIKDELGLDLRADVPLGPRKDIDRDAIYKKLMDYLIFITLEQSLQIRRLSKTVEEIKNDLSLESQKL